MARFAVACLGGWLLCCGGSGETHVADAVTPDFLEGLSVTEEDPVWVQCSGNGLSFEMSFPAAESFGSAYQGMRDALERGSDYAMKDGLVFNGDLVTSCEVLHQDQVLETW